MLRDHWSLPLFWAQVLKQFLWYFLPQLLHESILPALSLPSFSPKKHIRHITLTLDWPCSSPAGPLEASYWREEKSNIDETENVDLREVKPYKNKKISIIVDLNLKVILQEFFFFFFFAKKFHQSSFKREKATFKCNWIQLLHRREVIKPIIGGTISYIRHW